METKISKRQLDAYRKRVLAVLAEQSFVIGDKEKKLIEERIANGRRYFFLVGRRREGNRLVRRFIKIPANGSAKLILPFRRQIEFAVLFKKRAVIRTRGVVAFNHDPRRGVPYVIMETFPERHARIGFIENDRGSERLGEREAMSALRQLFKLQALPPASLSPRYRRLLRKGKSGYGSFKNEIRRFLAKRVLPLDMHGLRLPFYRVLERRLKIPGIREKINAVLEQAEPLVTAKTNLRETIVHGDLAPNNLYVFNSGDVEFLDLEWVGSFDNRAIALIHDFGNLRARAWNNRKFRQALDRGVLSFFRRRGESELGLAIVRLAVIRSHIILAGYFENYAWPKQGDRVQVRRRISTESDLADVFSGKSV